MRKATTSSEPGLFFDIEVPTIAPKVMEHVTRPAPQKPPDRCPGCGCSDMPIRKGFVAWLCEDCHADIAESARRRI